MNSKKKFQANLENKVHTHDNGRQRCKFCGRTIPKDVPRVSFSSSNAYGSGSTHRRICGLCILRLAKRLEDNEAIEDWANEIMVEEL